MPILGVIAEYNPFHNGHLHHLRQSRLSLGDCPTIAVMSGNFVQRGEPAICDKQARASMALKNGIDLVIELPLHYSTASAERFSTAAVALLDSTGVVTHMSFGSESGDLKLLQHVAKESLKAQETAEYQSVLRASLADGLPYFSACERALMYILRIDQNFIKQPNHILAIEYLKALEKLNSNIAPMTAERAEGPGFLKASAIRELVLSKDIKAVASLMPESAFFDLMQALSAHGPACLDAYSGVFHYLLKTKTREELARVADMAEGLGNRLTKASARAFELSKVLKAANTKRYPYSRLQRAALHLVLGVEKKDMESFAACSPPYIRILGFRKDASSLLGELMRKAKLPIVLNLKNTSSLEEPGRSMLNKELQCSDLYYLACESKKNTLKSQEHHRPLVIV
jgi:predicted nucleotidyltransferase